MRSPLQQTINIFFNYETVVPFLLSSVALSVLGSAIFSILTNTFGTKTSALTSIALVTLLIFVVFAAVVYFIIAWRLRQLPIPISKHIIKSQLDQPYRGLILLVSKIEPCEKAIQFHKFHKKEQKLEHCWLICSSTTLAMAQALQEKFEKEVSFSEPIVINNVYDPLEFGDRVNEIYQQRPRGWDESEIIADYVGMTAHASVGMVLACIGKNRPLQYTPAHLDSQGKIIGSLAPIKVSLQQP